MSRLMINSAGFSAATFAITSGPSPNTGAIISANTLPGTEIPVERGFTIAFTVGAVGALVALIPTFLLSRRATPRPVPEAV